MSQPLSESITIFHLDTAVLGYFNFFYITTKAQQKQKNKRSPLHHWNGCINAPEGVLAAATVFTNKQMFVRQRKRHRPIGGSSSSCGGRRGARTRKTKTPESGFKSCSRPAG